jgi:hypothetical protein
LIIVPVNKRSLIPVSFRGLNVSLRFRVAKGASSLLFYS